MKGLFREKQDEMVALALGEELETCGELEEALRYFEEAERLSSLHTYKEKERRVTLRVRDKIFEKRKKIKVIEEPLSQG